MVVTKSTIALVVDGIFAILLLVFSTLVPIIPETLKSVLWLVWTAVSATIVTLIANALHVENLRLQAELKSLRATLTRNK